MRQQATQPPNRAQVTRRPGPHGRDRAVGDSGTQGYRPASALFTAANAST